MALPWRPNKRLRCKTPPPRPPPQIPLPLPVELGAEADTDVKKSVYLVTLPHPRQARSSTGVILVAPESKSKKYVLKCVLDSCLKPMYMDARSIANGAFVQLAQAGNWRELHKENDDGEVHAHDHVALLAEASFRFLPVKRALLERHGLASHWSVTHTGYHSCVRYLVVPSPKKPLACLDHAPELWSAAGQHPLLSDCIHEPVTAAAMAKKRLKLEQVAAEKGKGDPRITDLDVWALVVRSGVRNSSDDRNAHFRLGQYAKAHCGMAMVHHLFRMRHKLPGMIDDIWQWEHINQVVTVTSRSRMQALRASALGPCVCVQRGVARLHRGQLPQEPHRYHATVQRCLFGVGRGSWRDDPSDRARRGLRRRRQIRVLEAVAEGILDGRHGLLSSREGQLPIAGRLRWPSWTSGDGILMWCRGLCSAFGLMEALCRSLGHRMTKARRATSCTKALLPYSSPASYLIWSGWNR